MNSCGSQCPGFDNNNIGVLLLVHCCTGACERAFMRTEWYFSNACTSFAKEG